MNKVLKAIVNNKWYLLLALIVMALIVKGYYTYARYQAFLSTPLTIEADAVDYAVKSGYTIRRIARDLQDMGLLEEPTFLVVRARMRELAQTIKVGEYTINKGTLPDQLLDQLVKGKVKQYSLTLIEGWTFADVMTAVRQHPELQQTLVNKSDDEIMRAIGHPDQHPEGRFFPETYRFPTQTTDVEFLKRAYRHMQSFLEQAWQNRQQKGLPLKTPYEALILASIIEKETAQQSEYREIAGVFTRRLIKGMRLQTDPTVIYGIGKTFDGNLTRKHLRQDTPYNTYTRSGLPPTPIAIPGADAIEAALNPAKGTSLYFVSKGNGMHHFSDTLKEHNEAVIRYQLKGDSSKTFSSRPRVGSSQ